MNERAESDEPSDILVDILDDLDEPALRAVRTYVERRLDDLRPSLREQIRSEVEGEIVDIEDHGAYTLVRKYPPGQRNAEEASQPLSLYRVKREKQLDGEETLHWSYLGDVTESPDWERQYPWTNIPMDDEEA